MRSPRLLALGLVFPAVVAATCGFRTIVIDVPLAGALLEDPGHTVTLAARVGANFDPASVEVLLDGVDLIAALGLVHPFSGAAGVVVIGATPVAISGFRFTSTNPRRVDLVASGLDLGSHSFQVRGDRANGSGSALDSASFEIHDPFALALEALVPGAARPRAAGAEGTLLGATLAQPLASGPVSLSDGGELRSGFAEASEALIAGGGP
jgi:hypothetical protein